MKKIILAFALCSILPAVAVAENKTMRNTHTSASDIDMTQGRHMQNTHTSKSDSNMQRKKHMSMGDNPFSSHKNNKKKAPKRLGTLGYSVVPYVE